MKLAIIIIVVLALVALLVYLNRKPTTNKKPIDPQYITGERMTLREALKRTWKVLDDAQADDIVQIDNMCQISIDREKENPRYKVLYISLDTMEAHNLKYVKENTENGLTTLFYDYPDGKALLTTQFQEITDCPLDGIVEYLVLDDKPSGNRDKTSNELPSPIPYESMTLETALEKTWEVLQDTETMDYTEIEIGDTGCQIRLDDESTQLRFCVVFSFSDNLERPNVPDFIKEKYEGDLVYLYYDHSPKGKNLLVQQLQEVLGCTLKDTVNYYHWVVK